MSDFQYGGWKMDTQLKKLENPMLRGYLISKAYKKKQNSNCT